MQIGDGRMHQPLTIFTNYKKYINGLKKGIKALNYPWKIKIEESNKEGSKDDHLKKLELTPEEKDYAAPPIEEKMKPVKEKTAAKRVKKSRRPKKESKVKYQENMVKRIRDILIEHKQLKRLYICKDEYEDNNEKLKKMMKNARKKCELPKKENIIGLIDLTARGSAKNCLVFGEKGIHFYNPWFGKTPGAFSIQYESEDFKSLVFDFDGKYEIWFGDEYALNVAIYGKHREKIDKIIEIFGAIKNL